MARGGPSDRTRTIRGAKQTVRSSRTPRADLWSHVECAGDINVMIVDGKKITIFK